MEEVSVPLVDTEKLATPSEVEQAPDCARITVQLENERLRITEYEVPAHSKAFIEHSVPSFHWQVLGDEDPTPKPVFHSAGSSCTIAAEGLPRHEFIFEILQPPKYTQAQVDALDAAALWPVKAGTELLLENQYARLWDFRMGPNSGNKHDVHQHTLDYAYVVLTPGTLRVYTPATIGDVPDQQGAVTHVTYNTSLSFDGTDANQWWRWNPIEAGGFKDRQPDLGPAVHSVENGSEGTSFREFLIELK